MAALIFLIIAAAVYIEYKNREQPEQQALQKQIDKKEVSFWGQDGTPYAIEYTPEDDNIKINIKYILSSWNPTIQLKNEVTMHKGEVLVYTSIDKDEQLIIAYLGSYPNGEAVIKKFDSVDEARNYIKEKIGIEQVMINVIKVKTGD